MELFVKRYEDRIKGIIAGPDRMLFRGTLRSISYVSGMEIFLRSNKIRLKDFVVFAQRATAKLRQQAQALAEKHGAPYRYLQSSSRSKEEYVRMLMEVHGRKEGLLCVLAAVEPCQTYQIRRNREKQTLDLVTQQGKCLHLYFYYQDREFGLMHVRLQTWFPFTIQVCLNGREWLARRMTQAGIGHQQNDNCFTQIADFGRAQQMLDTLTTRKWTGRLNAWARRVNPWLQTPEGRTLRGYYWTVRQDEYATDIVFRDSTSLAGLYPALARHAIEEFHSEDLLRFLGHRRPTLFQGRLTSHLGRRVEGLRVKHRIDENSIKMYDKQGSVLRVETTLNNPRRFRVRRRTVRKGQSQKAWLWMRKSIADLPRRHQLARAANARYLNALSVVGEPSPVHRVLDAVTQPVRVRGRRYRGLRPLDPLESQRFQSLLRGEYLLHGFRNRDLLQHWNLPPQADAATRGRIAAQIGRWLRLCRAQGLLRKVSGTQWYRITQKGQLLMTTALKLRRAEVAALAA